MGASSGGGLVAVALKKRKYMTLRGRQRANLSFFIVVMFFAVFGIIVVTEVFFIDERSGGGGASGGGATGLGGLSIGAGGGMLSRHGGGTLSNHQRRHGGGAKDYDENEDYISIQVGAAIMHDDTLGALLVGMRPHGMALPVAMDNNAFQYAPKENQLPPFPDNSTPLDGSWQTVNGTRYKFFVFSAFFDQRRKGQRIVRIIGATKTRGPERVWCRLWYKMNDFNSSISHHQSITVPAKVWAIRENWNLKYSACFATCQLPSANRTIPSAVSIVARPTDTPSNMLTVLNNYNESSTQPQNRFGICVKPLHFDYNRELQILEFIELNRLMGVDHFTFYNHTIGPQVACILNHYVERGVATILPWKLDMISQKEIRTEGLFAALNDCLYRSMYKFSHLLLIDLDEYVIPKFNDTLPQLVEYLSKRSQSKSSHSPAGAFSFQNAFFYLQWPDDDDMAAMDDPVGAGLVTLQKTRRRSKLHPHKQRSKYICRPEATVEAGNHFVWELAPGYSTKNAPSDAAILHHYRICEFGGNDCIKTSSVIDKTAYRYKSKLISAVRHQYDHLKRKCELSDLKFSKSNKHFSKIFDLLKQS